MADDLRLVADYLNDIRICLVLLTAAIYSMLAVWAVAYCLRCHRLRVEKATMREDEQCMKVMRWTNEAI